MMIANPTAASAAATVITNNTKTWPANPYSRENAMNVRFTALSINSTHMNTMIALRRVSTPITPMVKRSAEKNSASTTMSHHFVGNVGRAVRLLGLVFASTATDHHSADHRRQQEHAGHLEGEEIVGE